jgi:hypothetical protein
MAETAASGGPTTAESGDSVPLGCSSKFFSAARRRLALVWCRFSRKFPQPLILVWCTCHTGIYREAHVKSRRSARKVPIKPGQKRT